MNRRRFLQLSAMGLGAAALSRLSRSLAREAEPRDLIVVSNAGDQPPSVSLIDPAKLTVLATLPFAGSYSFPATRWDFARDLVWTGGPRNSVAAYRLSSGARVLEIPTGSSQNYTELTPDGRHLIVAARFADVFLKIAADPDAKDFGQVTGKVETYAGASPCDLSIRADGRFAYAPDRGGDTVTVLGLEPFARAATIPVKSRSAAPLEPYMGTVSPAGNVLLVENAPVRGGPDAGSESIFDLADPARPVEVARLSQNDGLGRGPVNSELTQDGRYGLVVCRDSSELSAVDTQTLQIVASVRFPEGSNPLTGTFAYGTKDDTFFLPLPGRDAVAAVRVPAFEIAELIPVGPRPTGVVYLRAPLPNRRNTGGPVGAALAAGRSFPAGCPDRCCGPLY